jgi:hypothetical protein
MKDESFGGLHGAAHDHCYCPGSVHLSALPTHTLFLTASPLYHFTHAPILQYTNSPIYRFANIPIHQYTDSPIYRIAHIPNRQYTKSPIHQYISTPIYQDIGIPIYLFIITPLHHATPKNPTIPTNHSGDQNIPQHTSF